MEQAGFSVVTDRHNGIPPTNGPRLGTIKYSNSQVSTPAFMFYTKSGSVPYISREIFEKIVSDDQVLFNFPLPTCLSFHQPLKEYKHGLNAFVGLEKYLSCCSITDCAVDNPQGFNKKDNVAIKTKSGNQLINYEKYMDIIEVFKPTMYVTLSISDINLDSSPSAIEKSVNISNRLFKSCLEQHHQSEVLKQSSCSSIIDTLTIKHIFLLNIFMQCLKRWVKNNSLYNIKKNIDKKVIYTFSSLQCFLLKGLKFKLNTYHKPFL